MDVVDPVRDQRTWARTIGASCLLGSGASAVGAACCHTFLQRRPHTTFATSVARGGRAIGLLGSVFFAIQGVVMLEAAHRLTDDANVDMHYGPFAVALERPRLDSVDDPVHVRLRWSFSWPPGT